MEKTASERSVLRLFVGVRDSEGQMELEVIFSEGGIESGVIDAGETEFFGERLEFGSDLVVVFSPGFCVGVFVVGVGEGGVGIAVTFVGSDLSTAVSEGAELVDFVEGDVVVLGEALFWGHFVSFSMGMMI